MANVILRNIEAERVRHGLTKVELADELGVTTSTYLNWLRGKTEIPSGKLIQMKKLWGVLADYILEVEHNAQ